MSVHRVGIVAMSISLTVAAYAANPFLDAKDDKPVSAIFRGTEWNDEFPEHDIPHEIPLTARVITTRVAKMPWGAIFKIESVDLKSRAPQPRRNQPWPDYFIVTDERIVLLDTALYVHSESGLRTMQQVEQDIRALSRKFWRLTNRRNSNRTTSTESRPPTSSTRRGYGKRQSISRAISVFTRRIIHQVISERLFGKKELG